MLWPRARASLQPAERDCHGKYNRISSLFHGAVLGPLARPWRGLADPRVTLVCVSSWILFIKKSRHTKDKHTMTLV